MIPNAFYSDPHFFHKNIIKYSNRPYNDIYEMRDDFIKRYNETISESDTVLWLGDCFFYDNDLFAETMQMMNGNKKLIRGNHDRLTRKNWLSLGFETVDFEYNFEYCGKKFRCSHYPYAYNIGMLSGKQLKKYPIKKDGEILIHGHTHSKNKLYKTQIHVGVDAWNYSPVRLEQIIEIARKI